MEIYKKPEKGFIEVWLTKQEQQEVDRKALTARLLEGQSKKCKVIFYMSGERDLFDNIESLLLYNLRKGVKTTPTL